MTSNYTSPTVNDMRRWDESLTCTGVAAVWCPVHGDCECVDREDRNDEWCPLHSQVSTHGERVAKAPERELTRYEYLRLLMQGHSEVGTLAPEELRREYKAFVDAELAELRRQERLRELWQWYALPKWQQPKFTDVTDV